MNTRGEVVCVDSDQNRVVVYDGHSGRYAFCFGSPGRGDGQFDQPCGMVRVHTATCLLINTCTRMCTCAYIES